MKIKKLKIEPENYNKDELTKLVEESVMAFSCLTPYLLCDKGLDFVQQISNNLFINIARFVMGFDDYEDLAELLKKYYDIELED